MAYATSRRYNVRQDTPSTAIANFLAGLKQNASDEADQEAADQSAKQQQQLKDMIFRSAASGKMTPSYTIDSDGKAKATYSTAKAGAKSPYPGAGSDFQEPDSKNFDMTTPEGREEYLSQYPTKTQMLIKQMVAGKPTPGGMGAYAAKADLQALAAEYSDGKFDPSQYLGTQKYRSSLGSTNSGSAGSKIASLNQFVRHANQLSEEGKTLHNGPFWPVNAIMQAITKSSGPYDLDKQAVSSEIENLLRTSDTSSGDIDKISKGLDANLPDDIRNKSIAQAIGLAGGRLKSMEDQYSDNLGETAPTNTFVKPDVQKIVSGMGLGNQFGLTDQSPHNAAIALDNSTAQAPGAMTSQATPQNSSALQPPQSGDIFHHPNGNTYVRDEDGNWNLQQ